MFNIPLFIISCENWDDKKQALKQFYSDNSLQENSSILTDFFKKREYHYIIFDLFYKEMEKFRLNFNFNSISIKDVWFEKALKGMYHGIHNHGTIGYSSVCYINYNNKLHTPLTFVSPFDNFLNGELLSFTPDISEGDILFFPSVIKHFTLPNKSDEPREVVSFNLNIN